MRKKYLSKPNLIKEFGSNLKVIREFKHITLNDLAKEVGLSSDLIASLETGSIKKISYSDIDKLAKALNLKSEDLIYPTDISKNESFVLGVYKILDEEEKAFIRKLLMKMVLAHVNGTTYKKGEKNGK